MTTISDGARVDAGEISADHRAHAIFDQWDRHPDAPAYWFRLPSWVQAYATECVAATERRRATHPVEGLTGGERVCALIDQFQKAVRDAEFRRPRGPRSGDHAHYAQLCVKADELKHQIIAAASPSTHATDAASPATAAGSVGEGKDLAFVIAEAKRTLRVVQCTMECNADDERRWADTIQWLEGLA